MASGAIAALRARAIEPSRVLIVVPRAADGPALADNEVAGDHPIPGEHSANAADEIARFCDGVQPDDDVIVLVSGGTTSLIASPVDGVTRADLASLFRGLLASGVDIATMNAVRKRVLRWGAGRLAAALHPARVHCLIASDVIGNDLSAIGSGPCVPDPSTGSELLERIASHRLSTASAPSVAEYLDRVAAGTLPETPKPRDAIFERTETRVILDASSAIAGAVECAMELGIKPRVSGTPIVGNAADAGEMIARSLLDDVPRAVPMRAPTVHMWWGETTVRLPPDAPAGGRCQELALACALVLHHAGDVARGITVLAAGTDGRDGPTDAAGAVVDASTWSRIRATGRDPVRALADHAAHTALDAAGALLRTGPTGTNVNDIALALVEPQSAA
jgi:hydroxypyruvate reductase